MTPTREELRLRMIMAPPVNPADTAFSVANADLVREDYAASMAEISDATAHGKRLRIVRYGLGAALGGGLVFLLLRR